VKPNVAPKAVASRIIMVVLIASLFLRRPVEQWRLQDVHCTN
jgi:hypothetical protein